MPYLCFSCGFKREKKELALTAAQAFFRGGVITASDGNGRSLWKLMGVRVRRDKNAVDSMFFGALL